MASKTYLTSGSWEDRCEVRLCGSVDSTPLLETTNGKLVAHFSVVTIGNKNCTRHDVVAAGELAQRARSLKRGELVKIFGGLKSNGVVNAWRLISHQSEGAVVAGAR
jgi:hypothetical protein